MKIDGLKIAKVLKTAGIDQDKAADLAQELADADDNAEKDMVSLKDLDAINARSDARIEASYARSDARIEAAINRQIVWTVATYAAAAAIIIVAMKL
ncbi:hypothetical protein [Aureimonas ureilytica]|uniref:hypothetical protein n=1 Tax=Aureimonas ureilytica TaxID=401562 RepID=UPI000A780C67|nr:hypothetical protein [Aureimonas ureilytica]